MYKFYSDNEYVLVQVEKHDPIHIFGRNSVADSIWFRIS